MENVRVVPRREIDAQQSDAREGSPRRSQFDTDAWRKRLRKLEEWLENERVRQSVWRYQMALDEDFYDGLQWDDGDAQVLIDRGQAPLVYNKIQTSLDWVTGTERRTRMDFKVFGRSVGDRNDADNKTKLMKYVQDVNKSQFARSRAFSDAAKVGVGWLEAGLRRDPTKFLIYDRYESWRNMLWDSYSVDMDLGDCRYLVRQKWTDLDLAVAMFPERRAVLRAASVNNDMADNLENNEWYLGELLSERDRQGAFINRRTFTDTADALLNKRERIRLYEMWYFMPTRVQLIVGGGLSGVPFDPTEDLHDWMLRQDGIGLVEQNTMMLRCNVFIKGSILVDAPSPYRHNQFPFTPIWGKRRGRDGMPYGVTRNMRDPQESFNKRMSKALHVMSTRRVIMEDGAVEDIDELREEAARPDGIIVMKLGKKLELITDTDIAEEHLKYAEIDSMLIEHVGGVTDELLGRKTNAVSGKAIEARQDQGSTVTTYLFDNNRFAFQTHGQKVLSLCEQFITFPMAVRVIGERQGYDFIELNRQQMDADKGGQPDQLNDITKAQADFIVSAQDYRETLKQATFEQLMDMSMKLAQADPQLALRLIDDILEFSDVPGIEAIIKTIREMTGKKPRDYVPTPQEAEQIAAKEQADAKKKDLTEKLEMQQLMGEVMETFAKVDKLKADALKAQTEAQNAGGDGGAAAAKLGQIQRDTAKLINALRERVMRADFKAALATASNDVKERVAELQSATQVRTATIGAQAKLGGLDMQHQHEAEMAGDEFQREQFSKHIDQAFESSQADADRSHEQGLTDRKIGADLSKTAMTQSHATEESARDRRHEATQAGVQRAHDSTEAQRAREADAEQAEAERTAQAQEGQKARGHDVRQGREQRNHESQQQTRQLRVQESTAKLNAETKVATAKPKIKPKTR